MIREATDARKARLWKAVEKFVRDNDISCGEAIYQTDRVAENSYSLIEKLCRIVGFADRPKDTQEDDR